jgi:surface antigen
MRVVFFIKKHRTIKILHIFRSYASFIVVVSCSVLVSATNLSAGRGSGGFLFGYFENNDNYSNPLENKIFLNSNRRTSLALAPLAEAKTVPNPSLMNSNNDSSDPLPMDGKTLVAVNSPVLKDPEVDGGVAIYEVKQGDTVSSIATANHISINTILWANALDNVDSIMPGDKLFILPLSGLSYTVKKGDDIDSVAKQFKADKDKIIAFNSLHADGKLKEGQDIIIPDGQKDLPAPKPVSSSSGLNIATRPYESFDSSGKTLSGDGGDSHRFPYGYCTWYVAQRVSVPWSGNAGTWLYHAKSAGYATGRTPRVGSIMVTSESWWGHVAYVESVKGNTFTVSEMNYKAWGKKDFRTVDAGSRVIKGFIYSR